MNFPVPPNKESPHPNSSRQPPQQNPQHIPHPQAPQQPQPQPQSQAQVQAQIYQQQQQQQAFYEQQQQRQIHQQRMNGMNGGVAGGGGGGNGGGGGGGGAPGPGPGAGPGAGGAQQPANGNVPGPTPAGHQAELNYIYGMVEELSRQLAENRRATENIVSGIGRVRSKAKAGNASNEELLNAAADDINNQTDSLDEALSILTESLERAKMSRDANASLLQSYATSLSLMLKHLHEYKLRHLTDVTAWHKSYRSQLDEARRENSQLREQVWEMQAHAGKANDALRQFRKRYDEDEERWEGRVREKRWRQEVRFWKRMAMPGVDDSDAVWSDDDDIVDEAEKRRLKEVEEAAIAAAAATAVGAGRIDPDAMEDSDGEEEDEEVDLAGGMGGVAMQRRGPGSVIGSTGSVGE